MPAILKTWKATIGTKTYFFLQSATGYQGSLDTICGLSEAEDDEQDEPVYSVAELINKNVLLRVRISYQVGTTKKQAKLLVTRDKIGTALDSLIGETYRGGTIRKAGIKRDATFF